MKTKTKNTADRPAALSMNQFYLLVNVALTLHRSHVSLVEKQMDGYSDSEFAAMCNATMASMTRDPAFGREFTQLPVGYIAALREQLPILSELNGEAIWLARQYENELRA